MAEEKESNGEEKTDFGLVRPRIIEEEMKTSYLDYAMSVIVARALPDVRDGLKPVHRRVLYSMYDMGLTSKSKYRKSATVVGDVLGKYHPHGDLAVYDTLVRMAQQFAIRHPLVDGQGNFGSIDGDEPAAMRYTECRMAKIADEMLSDISKNTVNFIDNYDATRQEPQVLPAKFPNLLINGSMGIAVGMATNIPPHNLSEVVDATVHLIDNPDAGVEDLMQFIKGPDFPTGGIIYNIEEIKKAYLDGQGKVVMRAKAEIVEDKKSTYKIIVNEIPYQVNKANLIEQIAKLVKDKKIIGISDIRDESDKDGIRIVIELKRDAYPKKILNQLFKNTQMQSAFHVNMLALVDGIQPRVLNLKNVLNYYIAHRKEVVKRRTEFDLEKAKAHAHILEGLLKALKNIDAVVDTIKKSENREKAHQNLVKKFSLSDKQAEAILEMRLSTLSGLEQKKIEKDYEETKKLIAALEKILSSEKEILNVIKKELETLKKDYGQPRRTQVNKKAIGDFEATDLIPDEQVIVTLTLGNYVKRMPINTYRSQARGGKGVLGITTKHEDTVSVILEASTHDDLLFFTNKGRVFTSKVYEITSTSRQAKGQAIVNMLSVSPEEKVTSIINISARDKVKYLLMATKKGLLKKTSISAYQKVRKSGLIAIRLRKDDELDWVRTTSGEDQIILATRKGMAIRFSEKDIRPMGRAASGVRGIRLRSSDEVIGMEVVAKSSVIAGAGDQCSIAEQGRKSISGQVVIVTEKGKGKRTPLKHYPVQRRGGIGLRTARLNNKTGDIAQMKIVDTEKCDTVIISKKGIAIRMPICDVKSLGRATCGVRLMRLMPGDKVGSITVLEKIEEPENNNKKQNNKPPAGGNNSRKGGRKMQEGKNTNPKKPSSPLKKDASNKKKKDNDNYWGNQGIWKRKDI